MSRHHTLTALHDLFREGVEIARAPVIAEPLPRLADLGGARLGEVDQLRPAGQEPAVEQFHPAHLGLLQHHLRDQDVVRVPGAPPGEIAPVPAEPAEEAGAEGGEGAGVRGAGQVSEVRGARCGSRGCDGPPWVGPVR